MKNVFDFRDELIADYSSFSRSFTRIAAADIIQEIEAQYSDGRYWPEALIQINPNYKRQSTVQELTEQGVLHKHCAEIFQVGKQEKNPQPLHLYTHQLQAIAKAHSGQSYVVTTGTGSGKSLSFFIPVIDKILKEKAIDPITRTRAIVIYPMNALANSQLEELNKFLEGYIPTERPFTVARYTGQESSAEREATPTSQNLYLELFTDQTATELSAVHQFERLAMSRQLCIDARVLHWPLAFPQVFSNGGFDCVLGNPPWERIKLQEEEFFATRNRYVAEAKNKAERSLRIEWLAQGVLAQQLYPELKQSPHECEAEQRLYQEFIIARRTAEAASVFAHVKGEDGGRYPLTGVGDVNTYALFAETITQIVAPNGRAGFIVPTGIATDDSTKAYFGHIAQTGRLAALFDFENRDAIFQGVHRSYKFCLITLGQVEQAEFAFFLTHTDQLTDMGKL